MRLFKRSLLGNCDFGIIYVMAGKKRGKKVERPVFDSIRKPTAPPSRKIGTDQAEEKRLPSLRKAKHKKDPDPNE